jgi:hypothetical protein
MVIYKTVNQVNGKWYIGKDAKNRPYYLGSGKALKNALVKYGKQNFTKVILEECLDLANLSEREKHWITITSATSDPMSYNIASGGEGGDLSKHINYAKIDRSQYKMDGTKRWFNSLTDDERNEFHAKQGETRSQTWYISKISDSTEIKIKNIYKWCKENGVDETIVSNLTHPNHRLFQKQTKGWRFRKEGQDSLPPYINKRKIGHQNIACKGKSWKLIDGKRSWFNKEGETS